MKSDETDVEILYVPIFPPSEKAVYLPEKTAFWVMSYPRYKLPTFMQSGNCC